MNFQNLPTISPVQDQLDVAFRAAKIAASKLTFRNTTDTSRIRKKELKRIEVVKEKLCGVLKTIVNSYPRYQELNDFYRQLFDCYISADQYKQDLSKLAFAEKKIFSFSQRFSGMIKATNDLPRLQTLSKEFYGRVSSVMKRVSNPLIRLEEFRRALKGLPDIKDDCVNVVLFGFPNVGKSTLLSKITPANPKIAGYAFTTQDINMGYQKIRNIKIQILDTPGTLNRFEKMNDIEKIAYLSVHYLADLVVYVFDPTQTYSLEDQDALYNTIGEGVNAVALVSKVDLVDDERVAFFKEKYGAILMEDLAPLFSDLVDKKERAMLDSLSKK